MKIFQIAERKKIKFKKARKKTPNQLGLFEGQIHRLGSLSFFEEALKLDELGDNGAEELYLKSIQANEHVAESYCNLGIIESEKNPAKAFGYFLKALKFDPSHCESHFNLANHYFSHRDYHLAKLHYEIAIEVEPGFPNSFFNLALACIELQDYNSCEKYLSIYKDIVDAEEAEEAIKILDRIHSIKNLLQA